MVIDFLSSQRFSLMAPREQTWKDEEMSDSSKKWYNSSSLIGYNYCSMPRNSDVNWIVNFFFVLRMCLWFNSMRISHSIPNQGWKSANDLPMEFYTASENNPYLFRYRDFFVGNVSVVSVMKTKKNYMNSRKFAYQKQNHWCTKSFMRTYSGMLENESSTISTHTLFINCKELLNPDCCCFRWAALNFSHSAMFFCVFFSVYYVRITFFTAEILCALNKNVIVFFYIYFWEKNRYFSGDSKKQGTNIENTSLEMFLFFFSSG